MTRNPHVHTYRDTSLPRDRHAYARHVRAAIAADRTYWRRGKPGRLAVAADTFGTLAGWFPYWRNRLAIERHTSRRDSWRDHRSARLSAAITAARIRQEQRRAALDRQARARAAA